MDAYTPAEIRAFEDDNRVKLKLPCRRRTIAGASSTSGSLAESTTMIKREKTDGRRSSLKMERPSKTLPSPGIAND